MKADIIRAPLRVAFYEPYEDELICKMHNQGRALQEIADALCRSVKSVQQRLYKLRKAGEIAGYCPRRLSLETEYRAVRLSPPLTLDNDDELVSLTRGEGGFPKAVLTAVGTVWANGNGMPWAHGRALLDDAA